MKALDFLTDRTVVYCRLSVCLWRCASWSSGSVYGFNV